MSYKVVELSIDPVIPWRDVLIAVLSERGADSFEETTNGLKAYVDDTHLSALNLQSLAEEFDEMTISYSIGELEEKNWNEKWESDFHPIPIDIRCVIRAPFHDAPESGVLDIIIQPKMSFGTGHHQTTYMISEELLNFPPKGLSVLDMGSGTGVLAVLAQKLGATEITAIDIDSWSVENCVENFELNGCEGIPVRHGGAETLKDEEFDVILANINRNILQADMEAYSNVLAAGGKLVFSGFYDSDVEILEKSALRFDIKLQRVVTRDSWAMMVLKKH